MSASRALVLLVSVAGCSSGEASFPLDLGSLDADREVKETVKDPKLEGARPRVVEVITAAGDVRSGLQTTDAIWLATAGGVVRSDGNLVEQARFTTLDGLPSNDVWALLLDGDRLFIATAAGVASARISSQRLIDIELVPGSSPRARDLALLDGKLFSGSWGGGVQKLVRGRFQTIDAIPANAKVTRLRVDGARLWVATADQGVIRFDRDHAHRFAASDGLPSDLTWDVLVTRSGAALIAATGGLTLLDGETAHAVGRSEDVRALGMLGDRYIAARSGAELTSEDASLAREIGAIGGLDHPHALVRLGGREGLDDRLLVCAEEGATLLDRSGRVIARTTQTDLPSPDLTALAVGREGLWVGTFDRGIARIAVNRDTGARAITRFSANDGLVDDRVNAIAVRPFDTGDETWIGTARGLSIFRDGQWRRLTAADGLPDDHVNALLAEADGVWVATTHGVAHFTDGGVERLTPERGLPGSRFSSLARGLDGALWIGSAHGLARLDPDGHTFTDLRAHTGELPDDFVTAVAADASGIWAGTYASGISHRTLDKFSVMRERDGLPSGWINAGAVVRHAGREWFGTVERGLEFTDGDGHVSAIGTFDGLPSPDVTALASDGNSLWVATRGGIARVISESGVGR